MNWFKAAGEIKIGHEFAQTGPVRLESHDLFLEQRNVLGVAVVDLALGKRSSQTERVAA